MQLRLSKILFLTICAFAVSSGLHAQSKRIIYFTDKGNNSYSLSTPSLFLSSRSLERRNKYGISIDSTDLPVSDFYTDSLLKLGNIKLLGQSRWLNAVLIQTDDTQIWSQIQNLTFVQKIEEAALRITNILPADKWKNELLQPLELTGARNSSTSGNLEYGAGAAQINLHNGSFLHRLGATGAPMLISFMDAGYTGYLSNPFLDSAISQNRIVATRDFVSGDNNVNEDNQHGLNCLSITAGNKPRTFVGSCPDASFILLRTEDAASEYLIEEFNWAMGAEYADSCGTDVISSSLSYTTFDLPTQDHSYSEMDGNTTIISRAADIAAKKGILVVTSAGNDGGSAWKYIGAPADADSVLAVGAVNTSGIIAGFSSYGPTTDKRIKPDVVGMGVSTVLSNSGGGLSQASGTSFSTPVIAGLASCLWQLFPEVNGYQLIQALRESSDRFSKPEEQYGYGIPDMRKAYSILLLNKTTSVFSLSDCRINITWSSKDQAGMRYLVQRKTTVENNFTTVYQVASNGTTFSKRTYTYSEDQNGGDFIYRILQIADTSATNPLLIPLDTLSVSNPVSCDENGRKETIEIFPNPVVNNLNIKFNRNDPERNLSINIINAKGELILNQSISKPTGIYLLSIPISNRPVGLYLISIRKGNRIYGRRKFIISED